MRRNDVCDNVGLVGLGNMGGAIADRLLARGVRLHVCDLDPSAVDRVASAGAIGHQSVGALAKQVSILMACLPTVPAAASIAAEMRADAAVTCYVEMSTIGPQAAQDEAHKLDRNGIGFVDAPVSGGAEAARQGMLSIMVASGDAELNDVLPILKCLSDKIFRVDSVPGKGQAMKLVNNFLAAANMATSFEALALGVKFGLEPAMMANILRQSSGNNTGLIERRINPILARRFDSGPKLALLQKDVALAVDCAREYGIAIDSLPALAGTAELWAQSGREDMAGEDVCTLIRLVERALDVEVSAKTAVSSAED